MSLEQILELVEDLRSKTNVQKIQFSKTEDIRQTESILQLSTFNLILVQYLAQMGRSTMRCSQNGMKPMRMQAKANVPEKKCLGCIIIAKEKEGFYKDADRYRLGRFTKVRFDLG
ncbi:hypothetical protein N0V93_010336 [Gnomoniopsis smithogilvyi]|uniref:Uncharacterized protein n=1 Tax=Gnomoniopsis smithogilvyi TaxID=1191159 RepID=A0A9W9CRU2_9PEZI|nr:hypothetical protein N0V93_010336 [Gnomoniopsis smithogilvyi]